MESNKLTKTTAPTGDFEGFGLHERLLFGLSKNSFSTPTPIQAQAIPPQMEGHDLMGLAETGTGKTAAFGLPLLHSLIESGDRPNPKTCRALILCPTRELAVQIEETLRKLSGGARLSMLLVLGGIPRNRQIRALAKGVDVLIATPGRLTDLMSEGHVRFDETSTLILDEADRMLDMGFVRPVQRIAERLHPRRRTALFSATMPKEVEGLAAQLLNDPVRVEVSPPGKTVPKITQSVELLPHADKRQRLAQIVSGEGVGRVIVFTRTKRGADRVAENLEKDGIKADAIHGNKAQNARQRALKSFADGRVRVLVATDIAARGIDVKDITHVVQFEMPDEPEAYVHRIGRTGRNGAEGTAIALCCPDERDKLKAVEKLTKLRLTPDGAEPAPQQAKRKPGRGRPYQPHSDSADRRPRHDRKPDDRRKPPHARAAGGRAELSEAAEGERKSHGYGRSDKPRSDKPRSDKPRSDKPRGDKPRWEKGRPEAKRSDSKRPYSERSEGGSRDQARGEKRPADKRSGDKKYAESKQGEKRFDRKPRRDGPDENRARPEGKPHRAGGEGDKRGGPSKPKRAYADGPKGDKRGDNPRPARHGDKPHKASKPKAANSDRPAHKAHSGSKPRNDGSQPPKRKGKPKPDMRARSTA